MWGSQTADSGDSSKQEQAEQQAMSARPAALTRAEGALDIDTERLVHPRP